MWSDFTIYTSKVVQNDYLRNSIFWSSERGVERSNLWPTNNLGTIGADMGAIHLCGYSMGRNGRTESYGYCMDRNGRSIDQRKC